MDVILLILLAAVCIIFGPLITLWALNTLFPVLALDYTLGTWFAALWISGVVYGSVNKGK